MKYSMVFTAALTVLALNACDRPTIVTPPPTVVTPPPTVVPVVPGPPGPQGAPGSPGNPGEPGQPGKSGGDHTVIVVPPAPAEH